jgi:hypothetical protein
VLDQGCYSTTDLKQALYLFKPSLRCCVQVKPDVFLGVDQEFNLKTYQYTCIDGEEMVCELGTEFISCLLQMSNSDTKEMLEVTTATLVRDGYVLITTRARNAVMLILDDELRSNKICKMQVMAPWCCSKQVEMVVTHP